MYVFIIKFIVVEKLEEPQDYIFERSLKILILMSNNFECLGHLIRGFLQNVGKVLNLFQEKNDKILRRAISVFLHSMLKVRLFHISSAKII